MESDEDTRSSSSSSSSSNRPSSPVQQNQENSMSNENDRNSPALIAEVENEEKQRSRSRSMSNDNNSSQSNEDSNSASFNKINDTSRNQSMSPVRQQNNDDENSQIMSSDDEKPREPQQQQQQENDDDDELELSDLEETDGKSSNVNAANVNISHDDLSDVSDLESPPPESNDTNDQFDRKSPVQVSDLRQKIEERKQKDKQNGDGIMNDNGEKNIDEDVLDFEEEEGECREVAAPTAGAKKEIVAKKDGDDDQEDGEDKSGGELESGEELEEGEVTDDDENRPEENEPKPVCRFYTRGQCTWGVSCRFLHPGVTDKGNYTMFDMVRPVPVQQPQIVPAFPVYPDYRVERPPIHLPPHHLAAAAPYPHARAPPAEAETAWERGLRTAKEMMRKANKRKEQDVDFDEKKMNLTGTTEEVEKETFYNRERASPENSPPPYERPAGMGRGAPAGREYYNSPPAKFARGAEEDPYGRQPRYRELPAHRMPHYEEEDPGKRRVIRGGPTREVIVEKADEWSDPWMRKSPGRRGSPGREKRGRRERSYSSNSSYSSSSSTSRSGSSTSRTPSPSHRRRYDSQRSKEKAPAQIPRKPRGRSRSASPGGGKRRFSPVRSPYKRPADKKSPVPERRSALDRIDRTAVAGVKRKKVASPTPVPARTKGHHGATRKKKSSSSGSGSSSGSESDSSYSSSTSSTKAKKLAGSKREKVVAERKVTKKVEMTKKRSSPAKDDDKEKSSTALNDKAAAAAAKQKSTRREELLKQLRAVEDAIARKRSKI